MSDGAEEDVTGEDGEVHHMTPEELNMDEAECETKLDIDPFDKGARFRLSQIWIIEERNLVEAKKLLESVIKSDPKFMKSELYELLGDLENFDNTKNYV